MNKAFIYTDKELLTFVPTYPKIDKQIGYNGQEKWEC